MRLLHALFMIPLFCAPALAETVAPPAATHQGRRSAAEHFADANTTHDGHMTLPQAAAGYKSIAKSFAQIDSKGRGYVTLDDIKAWKAAKKAARQAAKHASEDAAAGIIRPIPAMHHGASPRAIDTITDMMVTPSPASESKTGIDVPNAPLDSEKAS